MTDTNDWAHRVDQLTAATVHEQLRTVVRDAEDMVRKFTSASYEQGAFVLDAQREMEVSIAAKIDRLSSEMLERMDAIASRLAEIEAKQKSMGDFLTQVFELPSTPATIAAAS